MAQPDLNLGLTLSTDNIDVATVSDTTDDYGQGSVEARSDKANILLWAKCDENGDRTFFNPDFGSVLTVMAWSITVADNGWWQGILCRIGLYSSSESYVEQQQSGSEITQYSSIVYYGSTNKFYYCIQPNNSGDPKLPTDTAYWTEVSDYSTLIENTNVQVFIKDFAVRSKVSKWVSELFAKLNDENFVNRNDKLRNYVYNLEGLIVSADANFAQGKPEGFEKIIHELQSMITT